MPPLLEELLLEELLLEELLLEELLELGLELLPEATTQLAEFSQPQLLSEVPAQS